MVVRLSFIFFCHVGFDHHTTSTGYFWHCIIAGCDDMNGRSRAGLGICMDGFVIVFMHVRLQINI